MIEHNARDDVGRIVLKRADSDHMQPDVIQSSLDTIHACTESILVEHRRLQRLFGQQVAESEGLKSTVWSPIGSTRTSDTNQSIVKKLKWVSGLEPPQRSLRQASPTLSGSSNSFTGSAEKLSPHLSPNAHVRAQPQRQPSTDWSTKETNDSLPQVLKSDSELIQSGMATSGFIQIQTRGSTFSEHTSKVDVTESGHYGKFYRQLAEDFTSVQGWVRQRRRKPSGRIARIVMSNSFDSACALMILCNSILIGFATHHAAINGIAHEADRPFGFRLADYCFSLWFLVELQLRIAAEGPLIFWCCASPNCSWNYFDTVVVTINLIDVITQVAGKKVLGANKTAIRTLRVLRVARALRVVRLVRLFKALRMMVLSILSSFTTLLWAMVLLGIVMFTFGIFLTQSVTSYIHQGGSPTHPENVQKLEGFFGSLTLAAYTLFQSVSGGVNWIEVSDPLFDIDTGNGLLFCFYIFSTIFAMLNIVTGVFLDTAMRAAQSDKDECISEQLYSEDSTITMMKNIFMAADADHSGEISRDEFEAHLQDERVRAHLVAMGIYVDEASSLFRLLDMDSSGSITVEEFLIGCMRIRGQAKAVDVATLLYENKRMVYRWQVFMAYVEKQFKARHSHERRIEAKLEFLSRDHALQKLNEVRKIEGGHFDETSSVRPEEVFVAMSL